MADALDRFVAAQAGVFDGALAELRASDKRGHWMWFVFPQIAGLGRSPMAQAYAIRDLVEARAYLAHPVLGPRLIEAASAMLAWAGRRRAAAVLGDIDAIKLRSSIRCSKQRMVMRCAVRWSTAYSMASAIPIRWR